MIYNAKNINDLNALYLHDYALKDIIVDYNNKTVSIHLSSPDNKKCIFNIKFYSFHIECFEPWGQGIYIDSFTTSLHCNTSGIECIKMDVLLNSGDALNILAKEVVSKIMQEIKDNEKE